MSGHGHDSHGGGDHGHGGGAKPAPAAAPKLFDAKKFFQHMTGGTLQDIFQKEARKTLTRNQKAANAVKAIPKALRSEIAVHSGSNVIAQIFGFGLEKAGFGDARATGEHLLSAVLSGIGVGAASMTEEEWQAKVDEYASLMTDAALPAPDVASVAEYDADQSNYFHHVPVVQGKYAMHPDYVKDNLGIPKFGCRITNPLIKAIGLVKETPANNGGGGHGPRPRPATDKKPLARLIPFTVALENQMEPCPSCYADGFQVPVIPQVGEGGHAEDHGAAHGHDTGHGPAKPVQDPNWDKDLPEEAQNFLDAVILTIESNKGVKKAQAKAMMDEIRTRPTHDVIRLAKKYKVEADGTVSWDAVTVLAKRVEYMGGGKKDVEERADILFNYVRQWLADLPFGLLFLAIAGFVAYLAPALYGATLILHSWFTGREDLGWEGASEAMLGAAILGAWALPLLGISSLLKRLGKPGGLLVSLGDLIGRRTFLFCQIVAAITLELAATHTMASPAWTRGAVGVIILIQIVWRFGMINAYRSSWMMKIDRTNSAILAFIGTCCILILALSISGFLEVDLKGKGLGKYHGPFAEWVAEKWNQGFDLSPMLTFLVAIGLTIAVMGVAMRFLSQIEGGGKFVSLIVGLIGVVALGFVAVQYWPSKSGSGNTVASAAPVQEAPPAPKPAPQKETQEERIRRLCGDGPKALHPESPLRAQYCAQ